MERALGLGRFLFGAVANQSRALGQAQVKGQQRAVLHADGPQGGAINLREYSKGSAVNVEGWVQDSEQCSPGGN